MTQFLNRIVEFLKPYSGYLFLAAVILVLFLLVMTAVLAVKERKLRKQLRFFMQDSDGMPLEEVLAHVLEDNQKVKIQLKNNVNEIIRLNEDMLNCYRKIGIVKYNAFPGMAGKVSSSIALLNNENNGLIINSMHGAEGCYTYVKEIMNGKSINPLTKEDEEALKIALQRQL